MPLRFGLLQPETRTTLNHLHPVVQVELEDLLEVQLPGLSVVQRQHDGPEGGLKVGPLVQNPEHLPRIRSALELHHQAEPVPIRLVPQVGDLVGAALAGQVDDLVDDLALAGGIRNLGDHQL